MATATVRTEVRRTGITARGLRLIGEYLRMHPLVLCTAISGATVYAACTLLSTVVLGRVTDSVLAPAFRHGGVDRATVGGGVVAVLAVAVVRAGGIVTRRFFANVTVARVGRDLRRRVLHRYETLPLAYHRSQPAGDLLAHVHADVEAATHLLGPLGYALAVVLLIVASAVMLVVTDPLLAVIGCTVLPGVALLNQVFMTRVEGHAQRAQRHVGEVSAVAHESVDGALVVKTLGREEAEVARFAERADALRRERVAMGRLRAGFEPALDAIPDVGIVLLLLAGTWRVSTGAISTGTLVQFVSLFQLLAYPMRLVGFLLGEIPRSVVGRERLEEVFSVRSTRPSPGNAPLPAGPLDVRVEGLRFAYPGAPPVLDGVDLAVPAAQAVAVVGATAAGKSTLVTLLAGLATPDGGRVLYGGVDVARAEPASLRASVSVVFQEAFLFATTVRENITLGAAVAEEDLDEALGVARAGFVADLPDGLDTIVGERGVTLSGGQRQRVALARALVRRPRVLILDDATSAVDPTVEAAILEGLRGRTGMTLVIVAHRVATIALADRVVFLDRGRIAATGTHRELLAHPGYRAMVTAYDRGRAA